MKKKDLMSMGRIVFVSICSIVIMTCMILLVNIDKIFTNEELVKNTPEKVFENNEILKKLLNFNELSSESQKLLCEKNEELFKKYNYDYRTISRVYDNSKYVKEFGLDDFNSTIEHNENPYEYRMLKYNKAVVGDAFNYLFSPFNPDGSRDNQKGLGKEWEKYNKMSTADKKQYIRSDIQHKYETLVEKEKNKRNNWRRAFYCVVLLSGLCIYFLVSKRIAKKNLYASKLAYFCIVCFVLGLVVYGFMAEVGPLNFRFSETAIPEGPETEMGNGDVTTSPYSKNTFRILLKFFLPSVVLLSIMEVYLAKKSAQDYYEYFLIPNWLTKEFRLSSNYQKRIMMSFLIYPLFFIVPLPIIGLYIFAFYILPMSFILGIIWIVMWIREGKEMDEKIKIQSKKAHLYCRHCGKLIDADSSFCRYCGKKL